jgi:hypothetical protein
VLPFETFLSVQISGFDLADSCIWKALFLRHTTRETVKV